MSCKLNEKNIKYFLESKEEKIYNFNENLKNKSVKRRKLNINISKKILKQNYKTNENNVKFKRRKLF